MRNWRESASIIIAAKNGLKNTQATYDYSLLFLKRHKEANFASSLVFPGGVIESADADLKWKKLYMNYGFNEKCFKSLYPNVVKRPEIFRKVEKQLPREISLRINAIRETFEECGILLCNKSCQSSESKTATHLKISDEELEHWQNKVHNDPEEFYNMCQEFECYPNLWALHEWANWLTPTFLPPSVRFDTAFFFTGLPDIPDTKLELGEIQESLWETPGDMMSEHWTSLLPPQQYEIIRIAKHKKFDNLLDYAIDKSKIGVQLFLNVKMILKDGEVMLFHGDSLYPEKPDYYNKQVLDNSTLTIQQLRDITSKWHRIEMYKDPKIKNTLSCKL